MHRALAIIVAGFVTGAVDMLAALASLVAHGATVEGVLRYIASGLIGAAALKGGTPMAWLGLALHFALTTAMAGVFLLAASRVEALTTHPWTAGVIYGFITWAAMVYVVVPLSWATGWPLPKGWNIVSGLLSHIYYVGIPIAHITRHALRGGAEAVGGKPVTA